MIKLKRRPPAIVSLISLVFLHIPSSCTNLLLCRALNSRPYHNSLNRALPTFVTNAGNELLVKKSRETISTISAETRLISCVFTSRKIGLCASPSEENEARTADTSLGSRISLKSIVLGSFATVTSASLVYYYFQGAENPIPLSTLGEDLGMGLLTAVLAGGFVKVWTTLVKLGVLDPRDSRKIIHTGSAPLFLLLWPFFSAAPWSRLFAATVPFINVFRLYMAGSGNSMQDNEVELANAVSRSGDAKEALGGPLVYVLVMFIATVIFWRENMIAVMSLSTMAAGDGMADLVGRRLGKYTGSWPFSNGRKSYAGTLAFFLSSVAVSVSLAAWFGHFGVMDLELDNAQQIIRITAICFICSLVELLPVGDDNWTVPISAALLTYLLFH